MNDMTDNQRDTLTPKAVIFEAAFKLVQKLNMSPLSNITDIENDMPVTVVTTQGTNIGIVSKQEIKTEDSLTVTYTLNEAVLYVITYPIDANGGTGAGAVQNLTPEDAIIYMGW